MTGSRFNFSSFAYFSNVQISRVISTTKPVGIIFCLLGLECLSSDHLLLHTNFRTKWRNESGHLQPDPLLVYHPLTSASGSHSNDSQADTFTLMAREEEVIRQTPLGLGGCSRRGLKETPVWISPSLSGAYLCVLSPSPTQNSLSWLGPSALKAPSNAGGESREESSWRWAVWV